MAMTPLEREEKKKHLIRLFKANDDVGVVQMAEIVGLSRPTVLALVKECRIAGLISPAEYDRHRRDRACGKRREAPKNQALKEVYKKTTSMIEKATVALEIMKPETEPGKKTWKTPTPFDQLEPVAIKIPENAEVDFRSVIVEYVQLMKVITSAISQKGVIGEPELRAITTITASTAKLIDTWTKTYGLINQEAEMNLQVKSIFNAMTEFLEDDMILRIKDRGRQIYREERKNLFQA